ncbi:MAG: ABC transporter substrate-binding protein [Acetobacteraceae bacterium]|nr:ABC transporter substrate-binding protein [Acetobacteraceae bacterium]
MTLTRRGTLIGAAALGGAGLAAASALPASAQRRGGDLVFAQEATVPTLDMHFSTSIATRNVAMNMYEMLVSRNENNAPVADLAEGWDESADGLTYTFRLRRGVKFHNGKDMTSADVLASWQRYARMALQRRVLADVEKMEAPDAATFVVRLKTRQPTFIDQISSFAVPISIHPAEQADREGGKLDPIGTGPFQFVEFVPDSHVLIRRFDGYAPNTRFTGTDGFAGRKVVTLDTVRYRLVREPGARVAGLETGEFHVVEDVPTKSAERLRTNREIRLLPMKHWWLHGAWVNHHRPPTDNLMVRRAIQTALDMEAIMEIATDGAYDLQPGLQYPGNPYYTDAGKQFYNVNDPARAQAMLRQANYQGQEVVIITNSSFQSMYSAAVVATEQLRAIGLKVRMDVFDWATAIARRRERDAWNFWFTGQGTGPSVGPFTAMIDVVSPQLNQVVADPTLDALYADLLAKPTEAERKAVFAKFQERVYEQVHFLKFGDLTKVQAARASVQGFTPYRIPRFWNVSLGA